MVFSKPIRRIPPPPSVDGRAPWPGAAAANQDDPRRHGRGEIAPAAPGPRERPVASAGTQSVRRRCPA
eukprot:1661761-Pyramimonas_sp.AAC.1